MNKEAFVEEHIIAKYDLIEKLGKGAYGIVWKALKKKNNKIIALKKIFDAFQNRTDAQRTFREVMYLQQLNHKNIIKLYNIILSKNKKDIYLVFEFMETDLHNVIRGNILKEVHHKYIIYQILKGIKYMHSANLIHRDLKPSNIWINNDCTIKIGDFGWARTWDKKYSDKIYTEYIATRWYRAPEIVFGSHKYSKAVDMWSVGCILGELIIGKPIFDGKSTLNQIELMIEYLGYPSEKELNLYDSELGKIIIENISFQPKQKFIKNFGKCDNNTKDFLTKLLLYDPEERLTIDEALNHPYVKEFRDKKSEKISNKKIEMPLNDNEKVEVKDYRRVLYYDIKKKKEKLKEKK